MNQNSLYIEHEIIRPFQSYKNYLLQKKIFFTKTRHFYDLTDQFKTKEFAVLVMAILIVFSAMLFGAPKTS